MRFVHHKHVRLVRAQAHGRGIDCALAYMMAGELGNVGVEGEVFVAEGLLAVAALRHKRLAHVRRAPAAHRVLREAASHQRPQHWLRPTTRRLVMSCTTCARGPVAISDMRALLSAQQRTWLPPTTTVGTMNGPRSSCCAPAAGWALAAGELCACRRRSPPVTGVAGAQTAETAARARSQMSYEATHREVAHQVARAARAERSRLAVLGAAEAPSARRAVRRAAHKPRKQPGRTW
jgi:hypothetical protein